jgi:hypothetical protein
MGIELKDILTFTGIEAESIDDFKENFNNSFVKKDTLLDEIKKSNAKTGFAKEVVDTATGKRMGALAGKLKTNLTKFGIEISEEDAKKKPLEEIIESAFETHISSTSKTIKELTEKANKNSGEQSKELSEKYSKLEQKYNETVKASKALGEEYNTFKEKAANDLKGVKILTVREQAMSKIPKRTDIEQKQYGLMLTGFENTIDSKFKIDLDENNQPFIADKKTGERFRNPAKAGEFLGIEEVLKQEAVELGISPKNPHRPPITPPVAYNGNGANNGSGQQQNQQTTERPKATPRR